MGYRVGIQCVDTQNQADDLVLSTVPPTITADGKLIRPVRKNDGWYLENSKITLSHPQCDPMQQFTDGAQIGAALLVLLAVIFGFRLIIKFLQTALSPEGYE